MRFLIVFLLCWTIGAINGLATEVVNLAVGEWAPYTSERDEKGKLLEKVAIAAFKLQGVDVKLSYFPWKRSYIMASRGEADGTFPWTRTPEREGQFVFGSVPMMTEQSVYFHLKRTAFDWTTMEDLKKYKVGVTAGYKNEGVYKAMGINADPAPSEELNFKKIIAGRIDVYETSKLVGYATLKKALPPEQANLFTHHPRPSERNEYFILFTRTTPRGQVLADKFDAGLRKLKASGAYAKILADSEK